MMKPADRPIAVCRANEVEAWSFPFFIRPPTGFEPAFLFLEEHLYNLSPDESDVLQGLVRIDSAQDLRRLGYAPGDDGAYVI